MERNSKILVTGHNGLVGSAMVRELEKQGYEHIVTMPHNRCDLRDYNAVHSMWKVLKPNYVINCAGLVGGINANNTRGGEFIYDNLMIQSNVIEMSRVFKVKKLLHFGSSCIYPRECPQPVKEEALMSSPLEETNIGYAVAKIAGIIMCRMYRKQYDCNFISVMVTNLYGINDNFNLESSHVLPAIIRKLHEAKINNTPSVTFWGTGTPRREFMFVDDLAEAIVFLMNNYNGADHINVGTGVDMQIKDIITLIAEIIDYRGDINFSSNQLDGTPRKVLDVSKLNALGWTAHTPLKEGIERTYKWFVDNYKTIRL
jgi:GDP-L-fucose synthase